MLNTDLLYKIIDLDFKNLVEDTGLKQFYINTQYSNKELKLFFSNKKILISGKDAITAELTDENYPELTELKNHKNFCRTVVNGSTQVIIFQISDSEAINYLDKAEKKENLLKEKMEIEEKITNWTEIITEHQKRIKEREDDLTEYNLNLTKINQLLEDIELGENQMKIKGYIN